MILCVFAHRGEAQTFIKTLKQKEAGYYQGNEFEVVITGEGPYEATKLARYLRPEHKVINFGIAGSLNPSTETNQIYPIRTHYLYEFDQPQFKSFSGEGSKDCITSFQRVLSDDYAHKLRNFSDIVDREAWMYAKICQDRAVHFQAYKLISDRAGNETACFDLKERAQEFSEIMYEHFLKLKISQDTEELQFDLPGSFTQRKKLSKVLNSLSKKEDKPLEEILSEIDLDINKYQVNQLIDQLENRLNPFIKKLKEKSDEISTPFEEIGAQLLFDPKYEKKSVRLNMEINDPTNIAKLTKVLSEFDFKKLEQLWEGDV